MKKQKVDYSKTKKQVEKAIGQTRIWNSGLVGEDLLKVVEITHNFNSNKKSDWFNNANNFINMMFFSFINGNNLIIIFNSFHYFGFVVDECPKSLERKTFFNLRFIFVALSPNPSRIVRMVARVPT